MHNCTKIVYSTYHFEIFEGIGNALKRIKVSMYTRKVSREKKRERCRSNTKTPIISKDLLGLSWCWSCCEQTHRSEPNSGHQQIETIAAQYTEESATTREKKRKSRLIDGHSGGTCCLEAVEERNERQWRWERGRKETRQKKAAAPGNEAAAVPFAWRQTQAQSDRPRPLSLVSSLCLLYSAHNSPFLFAE